MVQVLMLKQLKWNRAQVNTHLTQPPKGILDIIYLR